MNPLSTYALSQETGMMSHPTKPLFDPNDWQLEVERAIPGLKVQLTSTSKDWRSRLDQMLQYRDTMSSVQSQYIPYIVYRGTCLIQHLCNPELSRSDIISVHK